ncbi:hypothetical protein AWC38_SpisGene23585 [Stylophora pistillata]|uniref:Peptidase aspartic putative domain-containing protein n=1 Tax=Stylophora pistillata TaxID=50429 RepID=A0A2B4R5M3_STYPI|nr:hypothetical protein AWC38_SpisGene23585 [Stylophora pistillata]
MAEKSAKLHMEVSGMDERSEIVTRERNLPRYLSDYTEVPRQNKLQTFKNRRKSMRGNLTRKMNIIREYLKEQKDRAAAREADLAKLKVKQLKEKARPEAKTAAQKAQLEEELVIQEAKHEAGRKGIEALLLKEELDEYSLSDRMKDFEYDSLGGDNVKIETTPQVKQDVPMNDIKDSMQKVRKWLKTLSPKEEEVDKEKENDISKNLLGKERYVNFSQFVFLKSAMMTSLPKLNFPVFDGDPCAWPNWYGMFKALVYDQSLSKTQKMIYLKALVNGTAEKAIAGRFFDELWSGADLRAAANMQQIVTKLPPKIAVRWSRRKLELHPKEVDLNDLDEWLGIEVQVQEMAFGFASTKENSAQEKPKADSNKPKWLKKKKDVWNDTQANLGAKVECFVCKGEYVLTSSETWKKLTVNERWELAKKLGLCVRCLRRGHRMERFSLEGTCPVEGCVRRHHPQLRAVIAPAQLNPTAETFHPSQAAAGETSATGAKTNHKTCGVTEESVPRPGRVALQMIPLILEGEEIADRLGLDAERKPLRVAVFGAKSIVTDSQTVIVRLESIDGSVKKCVFLWTTPKICEMTAADWSPNSRKLDHLRDLEIEKPVEHGEVDVLIGSEYYEDILLPLEHRTGKRGEPVGVKKPLGWTIVGHVSETASNGNIANHVYTFHATFTPEMRADELMRKMWDEEVLGITNQNRPLTAEEVLAAPKLKVAESRCYAVGRYEVETPWQDDQTPLFCNRNTA